MENVPLAKMRKECVMGVAKYIFYMKMQRLSTVQQNSEDKSYMELLRKVSGPFLQVDRLSIA